MLGKGIILYLLMAISMRLLLLEIMFAKEDKSRTVLQWKTPRLSEMGRQGITVRTEWLSGNQVGNAWADRLNGNSLCGNDRFCLEKFNPTYAVRFILPATVIIL